MSILGIDTIAVMVSNTARAIAWYRDVLGLPVAYIGPEHPSSDPSVQGTPERPGHWVELGFARPLTRIHLCHMEGKAEPGPTGITVLTDDIHGDYDRMRAAGARFLSAPRKMEWGEWLCAFVDPDGNEFDLKQPASPGKAFETS